MTDPAPHPSVRPYEVHNAGDHTAEVESPDGTIQTVAPGETIIVWSAPSTTVRARCSEGVTDLHMTGPSAMEWAIHERRSADGRPCPHPHIGCEADA